MGPNAGMAGACVVCAAVALRLCPFTAYELYMYSAVRLEVPFHALQWDVHAADANNICCAWLCANMRCVAGVGAKLYTVLELNAWGGTIRTYGGTRAPKCFHISISWNDTRARATLRVIWRTVDMSSPFAHPIEWLFRCVLTDVADDGTELDDELCG